MGFQCAWARKLCRVTAVLGFLAVLTGFHSNAHAQYRAGSFVDGEPVFASDRKPRSQRRAQRPKRAGRQAVQRRVKRRPRQRVTRSPALRQQRPAPIKKAHSEALPAETRQPARKGTSVLQAVVSLKDQRMVIYKNNNIIARTTVSTGKSGHETPTGVFSIFQKRRYHRSNIYSGAPMPFMQRITWSGIALHQGRVPGYPASHGCVRLPAGFAQKFYKMSPMRMHIVVAQNNLRPTLLSSPNLPLLQPERKPHPKKEMPPLSRRSPSAPQGDLLVRASYEPSTTKPRSNGPAEVSARHGRGKAEPKSNGAPLRILVTRRSLRDIIVGVQRRLLLLDYEAGDVDGQIGPMTVAALKSFQSNENLKVTGYYNEATLQRLAELTGLPWPAPVKVYVRQDGEQIFAGPVRLDQPERPIGTHFYTLLGAYDGEKLPLWSAMTLQEKGRLPDWTRRQWRSNLDKIQPVSAQEALSRLRFPRHVRTILEAQLTVGSSLVIADRGSTRETGTGTDFIVLTD